MHAKIDKHGQLTIMVDLNYEKLPAPSLDSEHAQYLACSLCDSILVAPWEAIAVVCPRCEAMLARGACPHECRWCQEAVERGADPHEDWCPFLKPKEPHYVDAATATGMHDYD